MLIGGDSLHDFPTWREPVAILELATVIAVNRGRTPLDLATVLQQLDGSTSEGFRLVEMPAIDLSATDIRHRCRQGKSIRYQTPRAVELYIQQRRLYRD